MRPTRFQKDTLVKLLRRQRIATMPELKTTLGTAADMTVFRKLREIDYLTSYSHRGRFYALREIADFDPHGLWSCRGAYFSRFGSLLDTVAEFVSRSDQGYFSAELDGQLHVAVKDPLRQLVGERRLAREEIGGLYLYLSPESATRRQQRLRRQATFAAIAPAPISLASADVVDTTDEAGTALLLFFSLLDEQHRRLFAGLESLRRGWGGDRHVAELLDLDAHTVGRGRKELSTWDLQLDHVRRPGGGRKRLEKKLPK